MAILTFSNARSRGRPKNTRPSTDTGTPETVMKRALGVTTEALDLCLERGIITEKQHWCGIHLRWLYTLCHGVPNVRAINLLQPLNQDKLTDHDNPKWREAREKEYNEAISLLSKTGHAIMLMNMCIYNERPKFLYIDSLKNTKNTKNNIHNIANLRDGLDILDKLWKK